MENYTYIPFPFGRAEIPKGTNLRAEILGVDDGSYFHIAFIEETIQNHYKEMLEKMRACTRNRYCMPRRLSTTPGMECIVEYLGRRGGIYVRGKVIGLLEGTDNVRVELVDDLLEVDVHRTLMYHTTTSILYFPKFALKCKLADMDCFRDHPYVKLLYGEYMKGEWKPGSDCCTVQVFDKDSQIPTVRLTTCSGMDLTDVLQQYIPTFQRLEYPMAEVPTEVKITYCDGQGQFWFRPCNKLDIISLIKSRLFLYNDGYLQLEPEGSLEDKEASWKDPFTKGSGEVLIYKSQNGRKSYRVRELPNTVTGHGTVSVFYLDYGITEVVPEDRLAPARLVDPNLCFIPPQCLPVRFIGADCTDDGVKEFNLLRFWKYVSNQHVYVVMKEQTINSCFPQYVRKNSLVSTDYVDASLNFVPPECVPIRFISETLGSVSQQSGIHDSWKVARNMPVSFVLERFGIQCGQQGKYLGGILPPKADLSINLQPQLLETEEVGRSLYEIYHCKEVCLIHGPKLFHWDNWSMSSGKTVSNQDAEQHEMAKAAGNEETDSVSSLISNNQTSTTSPSIGIDRNNNVATSLSLTASNPELSTADVNNNQIPGDCFSLGMF